LGANFWKRLNSMPEPNKVSAIDVIHSLAR
jgi:hypothetical protein